MYLNDTSRTIKTKFYINYEECKLKFVKNMVFRQDCFILTMRNVNIRYNKGDIKMNKFYINYEECKWGYNCIWSK